MQGYPHQGQYALTNSLHDQPPTVLSTAVEMPQTCSCVLTYNTPGHRGNPIHCQFAARSPTESARYKFNSNQCSCSCIRSQLRKDAAAIMELRRQFLVLLVVLVSAANAHLDDLFLQSGKLQQRVDFLPANRAR